MPAAQYHDVVNKKKILTNVTGSIAGDGMHWL